MKKITVLIPEETFKLLDEYCRRETGRKSYYYKHIINLAIKDYCRKNTVN